MGPFLQGYPETLQGLSRGWGGCYTTNVCYVISYLICRSIHESFMPPCLSPAVVAVFSDGIFVGILCPSPCPCACFLLKSSLNPCLYESLVS